MSRPPKVSVIVPVFNTGAYLADAAEGILAQTLRDIEVIFVDDGSTDRSPAILAELAAKDARVRVLTRPHENAGAARNAGMDVAQGEFVIFLDGDDLFHPRLLETLLANAYVTGAEVSTCRAEFFRDGTENLIQQNLQNRGTNQQNDSRNPCDSVDSGTDSVNPVKSPPVVVDPRSINLFYRWIGWPWDKLIRRELLARTGLRFQSLPVSEDLSFCFSVLAMARTVCETEAKLVAHRYRAGSSETSREKNPEACLESLVDCRDRLVAGGAWQGSIPRHFRRYAARFAWWYMEGMQTPEGRRRMAEIIPAIRREFPSVWWWPWHAAKYRLKRLLGVACNA